MKKIIPVLMAALLTIIGCSVDYENSVIPDASGEWQPDAPPVEGSVTFDLADLQWGSDSKSVSANKKNPYVLIKESSPGRYIVEIDLRPPGQVPYGSVYFAIDPQALRSGWLVNIGDSVTNNGWAGDGATQQNDAELQILDRTLTVYASDKGNSKILLQENEWWDNRTIYFTIQDGYLKYQRYYENAATLTSPYLFALNGQSDSEGPVNYKIYAAFNRVIQGESRIGSGCGNVTITLSDPVMVHGGNGVYFGHIHNHSTLSDGLQSYTDAYNYAQNTAKLDFFGLADHFYYDDPDGTANNKLKNGWSGLKSFVEDFNNNPANKMVAFYGFEWSHEDYGHVAVINPPNLYSDQGAVGDEPFSKLINWLYNQGDTVAFLNHPGRQTYIHNGGYKTYPLGTPLKEFLGFEIPAALKSKLGKFVGMELWNKEYAFNFFYEKDGFYNGDSNAGFIVEANSRGFKLGASGSMDNHAATWNSTVYETNYRMAILAPAKNRADLWEAIKNRRFYSTLDNDLGVWMTVGGKPMGSVLTPGTYNLELKALDKKLEPFDKYEIFKNNTSIKLVDCYYDSVKYIDNTLSVTGSSGDFIYVKIRLNNGNEAITSPVFFE